MHLPSTDKLLLIFAPYLRVSPVAPVDAALSDPARSTRLIFEFIENLDIGYDVFMRHYTQGWSETVLFFRPRKC